MSDFMVGDKDNAVAVPFSDDESEAQSEKSEELLAEDNPNASPEERITRKKKQAERINRILQEGKQTKEELAQYKESQARLEREVAELRAQRAVAPPPPSDGKNPYQRRLDKIYERQVEAYNAANAEIKAGTWDDKRKEHYEQVARDIEAAKSRVMTEQVLDERSQTTRSDQARAVWEQKYPSVYNNPRAYQYAEASFRRKQALLSPNDPITNEMVDEAMNEAMVQFKLGPKKAPSASEKSRLSGLPSTGGGGGGGREGVQMTPQLRRMAIAAHSDLPEEEAIKKWVNGTGKRLREKKVI